VADDLKARIQEDVKTSMRARDRERLGILRQITAAVKQREIDERVDLDEAGVLAVLDKMLKQRRDSEAQYSAAGRTDLAEQEAYEMQVIGEFMPRPLEEGEIAAMIEAAIAETGAASMRDMGKVMGLLKPALQGRADLGAVSGAIKARLPG
jgi:uncharacterized protein YqeY